MKHTVKGLLRLWLRISTGQKERTAISHDDITDMDKYLQGLSAELREKLEYSPHATDSPYNRLLKKMLGKEAST